jgi:hypothetical protein
MNWPARGSRPLLRRMEKLLRRRIDTVTDEVVDGHARMVITFVDNPKPKGHR